MDIYFSDADLADLIMNRSKLERRFGAKSAEMISRSMAIVDAAENVEQVASFGKPEAIQCKTKSNKQFCLKVDEKHSLTFKTTISGSENSAHEAEVIRLDVSCTKIALGNRHV
ncbi:MAG: hypothetical protein HWE25_14280 [Alphaproteobacteria bacterium]|nr:hypothetical protein [Alphaproteobacteria bacterium]